MISRKVWEIEKSWNFHTVSFFSHFIFLFSKYFSGSHFHNNKSIICSKHKWKAEIKQCTRICQFVIERYWTWSRKTFVQVWPKCNDFRLASYFGWNGYNWSNLDFNFWVCQIFYNNVITFTVNLELVTILIQEWSLLTI